MTTTISTCSNRLRTLTLSAADFSSEPMNMKTEEDQPTTLTTNATMMMRMMMNPRYTASHLETISEPPGVVDVSDDDDEDTDIDSDADNDVPMQATTLLLSSTHLSPSSSLMSSSQRRRKEQCRRRERRGVRFQKEAEAQEKKATNGTGKKMNSGSSSRHNKTLPTTTWYTPQEIKDNYQSVSSHSSVMAGTDEKQSTTSVSSWFSYEKRIHRRLMRKQMYKIMQAIQDYERATQTKVPDLLAQLLHRHSTPMVEEGIRLAVEASTSRDNTGVC